MVQAKTFLLSGMIAELGGGGVEREKKFTSGYGVAGLGGKARPGENFPPVPSDRAGEKGKLISSRELH